MPYDIYQRDNNRRNQQTEQTGYIVPVEPQQQQMPQIDTSDAINSLAGLLVTPEEREARQRKLMENKRKMIGWTALFDGLRQMANLYTASRGANNMQFTDNPYQTIENAYRQEQQIQDGMDKYRDSYAKTIYNMQRQADQDKMRQEAQKAQIRWYDTRDEMARMKAENDKLKTEKYVELQDGRIALLDAQTGQIKALTPYKVDTEKSKAEKNRQQGNAAQTRANVAAAGTETTVTKPDGSVTTTIKKPAIGSGKKGGKSGKKANGKSNTRRRSTTQL